MGDFLGKSPPVIIQILVGLPLKKKPSSYWGSPMWNPMWNPMTFHCRKHILHHIGHGLHLPAEPDGNKVAWELYVSHAGMIRYTNWCIEMMNGTNQETSDIIE